ncbi:MAG: hypothetical protein ACM3TN_18775 [Alphaproteobacteria bacterium]
MVRAIFVFICLLFAVFLPAGSRAQQGGKVFRIGFLDTSTASGSAVLVDAFRQELSKLGWNEGKNITIEYRFAQQKNKRLLELAAELVRLKVDLIVASSSPTALAVGKMAARANVKTVVLSHMGSQRADDTNDYTPWIEQVKKHFFGQVLVAKDLMEF